MSYQSSWKQFFKLYFFLKKQLILSSIQSIAYFIAIAYKSSQKKVIKSLKASWFPQAHVSTTYQRAKEALEAILHIIRELCLVTCVASKLQRAALEVWAKMMHLILNGWELRVPYNTVTAIQFYGYNTLGTSIQMGSVGSGLILIRYWDGQNRPINQ